MSISVLFFIISLMFCASFAGFLKYLSRGWGFSTIFLPQWSGFSTFFVPGGWGIRPIKKIPLGGGGGGGEMVRLGID